MMIWFAFAVMTAVATFAVLAPLARGRRDATPTRSHDLAVYKDQLAEVERDRERGLIGAAEAEAARSEIARRLLKADASQERGAAAGRSGARAAALAAVVAVPAIAVGVYTSIGSPDLGDQPLSARLQQPPGETSDVNLMIARVEAHLTENPGDVEGWRVLAPIYARLGRPADAADAYARIMSLSGPTPDLQERYGEMLLSANEGLVTPAAQAAFDAAVAADPERIKARFFRAMGLAQAGRAEEALAEYDEIIRRSPADAPWLEPVYADRRQTLAALGRPEDTPAPEPLPAVQATAEAPATMAPGGAAPGIAAPAGAAGAPDPAAVAAMNPDERAAMIDQMVAGLAERLAGDPRDAEGWQRLIRAYAVLGRTDDAKAAYQTARTTFADDPAVLASLAEAATAAGIETN